MRLSSKSAVALFFVCTVSALGQNHPIPGAVPDPPVICTNCPGTNGVGEPNAGKPTFPYDTPVSLHAGRYVDSSSTQAVRSPMSTVRAGIVRVAPAGRNRIYLQLGEAVGAYPFDTFFSSKLREAMAPVNTAFVLGSSFGSGRMGGPFEKLLVPDRFLHPLSASSGWSTNTVDHVSSIDFDADDRAYLYVGTSDFGWGIVSDPGDATGAQLPKVVQIPETDERLVISLRNGDNYYAYTSNASSFSGQARLYDVTTPAQPVVIGGSSLSSKVFDKWSKHEAGSRVALRTLNGHVLVYAYADLIADAAPLADVTPAAGKFFGDLSFDDDGNLWLAESASATASNVLWKLTPSVGGYTTTTYDVYGSAFSPRHLAVGSGYIAVNGRVGTPSSQSTDLRLLKIVGGAPQLLDAGGFFQKYYEYAPSGYAEPESFATLLTDLHIVAHGGKAYLFYSSFGLGDVYELSEEPRITSMSPLSGIPAGGTTVTIYGSGFASGSTVTFDGTTASSTFVSATQMTAVSPMHASGSVNVVVTPPGEDAMTAPRQFTYELTTPQQFVATASSTTAVAMTWNAVDGATEYEISRRAPDGTWSVAGSSFGPSFEEAGRTPETTYVYRVRARDAAANFSASSAIDLATTMSDESSTITVGLPVLAVDFQRLRTRVNAMRAAANLSPASFTGTLSGVILREDVLELRNALNPARAALGLSTVTFTDNHSLTGVKIKAVHLDELLYLM